MSDSAQIATKLVCSEVRRPNQIKIRKVFFIFFLIYLSTWAGHYTSADAAQKIQWSRQMIAGGPYWVDITTGQPPKYGIGHSLLAIPALLASKLLTVLTGVHAEGPLYTIIFVLNAAILVSLVARYLKLRGYSSRRVWFTCCAVGLATSWWPYSKLDASESVVATLFLAGIVQLIEGRAVLGFLFASFVILLRTDAAVLLALLVAWDFFRNDCRVRWRMLLPGLMPAMALYAFVNVMRFGSVFDHGFPGEHFSNPLYVGLYGILFSAGKSVFLFSPALILGFMGWRRFKDEFPLDATLFVAAFVVQLLLYAKWWGWSGEDSWGVRFLLPSVVLMTIPAVEVCRRRVLTGVVLAAGVLVNLPALLLPPLEYVVLLHNAPLTRQALYVDGGHVRERIDFEDLRFDPRYSPLAAGYAMMELRLGIAPSPTPQVEQERTGTPITDVLRQIPQPQGCRWDLIWCNLRR